MVKDQIITEDYALYNGDNMDFLANRKENSIHLSTYSPPFAGLYNYSSDPRDMSNCESKEQFMKNYGYLVAEMERVTIPGRLNCVHVTEVVENNGKSWDFPGEVVRLHEKHGFTYHGRITVWKEPLKVRMRTMVQSLMHKFIVEDATRCYMAQPDYVLLFKAKGENQIPVTHEKGLCEYPYFGETPFLYPHKKTYGDYESFRRKWENFDGPITENKLAHLTWQRYASAVWDDVRIDNVLPFRESKEDDDEKHVHPLQLDVIDRLTLLYSNPGEVSLDPFNGVGSNSYSAVSMNRKAIGTELKTSYFKQSVMNMKKAERRFDHIRPLTLDL